MTPARADEIDRLAEVLRLEDTRARADRFAEFIAPDAPRPVRLRAIAALGSVGDPESADLLLLYLRDEDEDIAVAAARALGNVWDPPRLAKIGIGPDGRALDELEALFAGSFAFVRKPPGPPRVRAAAIDAFGRIATPERAVSLVRALRDAMLAPEKGGANVATASIFAIMRANPPGGREAVVEALAHADPVLRGHAAYALGRMKWPPAVPALEVALDDAAADVRIEAARALGRLGGARDAARLYPMLYGENEAEITAALMAFGPRERGVPPARVAELLAQVTEDKPARPMHLAGIDALGRRAEAAAIDMLEAQVKRHGALAIRAVRAMGEARASSALLRVNVEALARDPVLALAYMEALAACDADKARERIDGWLASTVRPAAFRGERGTFALVHAAALARTAGFDARQREFLEHDAMLVRAAAAEAIAARPDVVLLDPLIAAIARAANDPGYDAAHFAVAAVEAVGERFPAQSFARTKCVDALRPLLADPRGPVRERAAEALYTLAHERHDKVFFNIAPSRPPDAYARIARALGTTSSVNVETDRGPFVIDVPIGVAPLVADRFIELVRAKFYDGLVVHRVEPLFVMQTGDPMGTGYGGTGKLLPDETGAIAFDGPGVVGLATAGRDTGDSQWFVTHRATPHLDGAYTAFGRVASGIEVVLGIVPGDVIRRMTITGEGAPPPEPLASDELRVTSYECHRNIERQTAPNESTCRYPIASLRFHSSFVTRHSQFG